MRAVETPRPLRDVADPCTEMYYPSWSSRGMRAVRCTRAAKGLVVGPGGTAYRMCGVHLNRYDRLTGWLVERDGR